MLRLFCVVLLASLSLGPMAIAADAVTPPDAARLSAEASQGAQLFTQYCAACHGAQGHGGVGVPLALPSFIDSVDDRYLANTIKLGRPGRIMPSFEHLEHAQIQAITAFMRSWTGYQPPPQARTKLRGDTEHGRKLFGQHCASCHGDQATGGRGTGVTFSRPRGQDILAPALNNSGFLAAASDAMIARTIAQGRSGSPMPGFARQGLKQSDINDLVSYLRQFEKPKTKTAPATTLAATIVRESPYSVEQTVENLKGAILGANLRLIRVQHLDQGLVPEAQENRKRVIIYSCNFSFLNEALKIDPRVGLFLPCRVNVTEHRGKVLVMSINPKHLSVIFNNQELNEMCDKMTQIYQDMIEEAVM